MLETTSRRLLFDALRPPTGFALDRAVGTTFSLDLLALMTAPLAFTFFEWADEAGPQQPPPLALLEALRRYAGRISVFCQAGRIVIPKAQRLLFSYLENSVVEVTARHETGVFHPKIWLLRYTTADAPPLYRLLCLSRNLTFDRSWDTALVLDGQFIETPEPEERNRLSLRNEPLRQFLMALPTLATRPPAERISQDIALICAELDRVNFLPPDGFDKMIFWPFGIRDEMPLPFDGRMDQLLIIAPFLSNNVLKNLASHAKTSALVSRTEELAKCNSTVLEQFADVYALSPDADDEEIDTASVDVLSGLHAKVYVADAGWNAHVWTGSANATTAAFQQNVEFLIELIGKKSQSGVDQILGRNTGKNGLLSLLDAYDITSPRLKENPAQALFEQLSDRFRNALAKAALAGDVITDVDLDGTPAYWIALRCAEGGGRYHAALERLAATYDALQQLNVESLTCWPISRHERDSIAFTIVPAQKATLNEFARFGPLSVEALTSFIAFRLKVQLSVSGVNGTLRSVSRSCNFVLNIPLLNAPPDRQQRLLRSLLKDRQDVLRFLRLLLAGEGADMNSLLGSTIGVGDRSNAEDSMHASYKFEFPLMEALVRALYDSPEKLDDIQRLVTDLSSTPEGLNLLPEGFQDIWEPIWLMRQEIVDCGDAEKKQRQEGSLQ